MEKQLQVWALELGNSIPNASVVLSLVITVVCLALIAVEKTGDAKQII